MKEILTQPEITVALIALFGVLISVFLSLVTSRKRLHHDLEILKRTLKGGYDEKLLEQRLVAYPPLWKVVSRLSKDTLQVKFDSEQIREHIGSVLSELRQWYQTDGITLSKNSYGKFGRLCSYLDSYMGKSKFDNPADLKKIRQYVWDLRQMLRSDMHLESIIPKRNKEE